MLDRISVSSAFTVFLLLCHQVQAASICDGLNLPGQEKQFANCKLILHRHLIPDQAALRYTIQYWLSNRNGIKDARCALSGMDQSTGCQSCRDENWVKSGFENQCSFVINDLNRPWRRQPARGRTTAYYVDLCSDNPSKIVKSFYMNGGTGRRFDDTPDGGTQAHPVPNTSTLAGAFKLEGQIYLNKHAYAPAQYRGIMQRHGGGSPSIYMKGLNSSNDQTEANKPIHISPFRSSWGCPSVSEAAGDSLFNDMVSRGSTLYMAYAGKKFEQHGDSCINDSSGARFQAGSSTVGAPVRGVE